MTVEQLMTQNRILLRNLQNYPTEIIADIPAEQRLEVLEALQAWQQRWHGADIAQLGKRSEDLYRTLAAFASLRDILGLGEILARLDGNEQADTLHRAIDIKVLNDNQGSNLHDQCRLMDNTLYEFVDELEKLLPSQADHAQEEAE